MTARKVIMTGRLVDYKKGVIRAMGIPVRKDIDLPFSGDPVVVMNNDTGDLFEGEVTHVDWVKNTYDLKVLIE